MSADSAPLGSTPNEQTPTMARQVGGRYSGRRGGAGQPRLVLLGQLIAIGLVAAAGAGLIAFGQDRGPLPPQAAAVAAPLDSPAQVQRARAHALSRSRPVRVDIARLDVHADVVKVGVTPRGSLEVPPLDRAMSVGWYRLGPAPGEPGAAVVLGHVDAESVGPAVFYRLGELEPGDTLSVTRADGSRAIFTVTGGASYPKDQLPYGRIFADLDYPVLRLVTCGGRFDERKRTWENNLVVYAVLTDSHAG
jgi:Sortase domain